MRRHRLIYVAAALAAIAPVSAAAALPPDGQCQHVSDRWTSSTSGTSNGRRYAVDPADPSGKPPAVRHVQLQLPSGARFNTDAIAQYEATDTQLIALGAGVCPAASRLGTMRAHL